MNESFIFVSHATEDLEALLPLITAIEKRGEQLWMASRDISPGAIWSVALNEAIRSCRCVLLVLSKRSNNSSYVANEISVAHTLNKPIVVLRLDDVEPSPSLVMLIAMIQRLDAFGRSPAATAERLVLAVRSAVHRAAPELAPPAEEVPLTLPAPARDRPRFYELLGPKKIALGLLPALLILTLAWHHLTEEEEPRSNVYARTSDSTPIQTDSAPTTSMRALPASPAAPEEAPEETPRPAQNLRSTSVTRLPSPEPQAQHPVPPPTPRPSFAVLRIKARYFGIIIGDRAFVRAKPTAFDDYFATSNLPPKSSLQGYFATETSALRPDLDAAALRLAGQAGHTTNDPYLEDGAWCLVWNFDLPPSPRTMPTELARIGAALRSLATRTLLAVTNFQ